MIETMRQSLQYWAIDVGDLPSKVSVPERVNSAS